MLNKLATLSESVTGSHPIIDQWLLSRRQLLVAYYKLAGITPGKHADTHYDERSLTLFSQHLVDYLSCGHFRNFEHAEALLTGQPLQPILGLLYPQLEQNTHMLLELYERYLEPAILMHDPNLLNKIISEIGETIENRFMLEDQLIITVKSQLVATSVQSQPMKIIS